MSIWPIFKPQRSIKQNWNLRVYFCNLSNLWKFTWGGFCHVGLRHCFHGPNRIINYIMLYTFSYLYILSFLFWSGGGSCHEGLGHCFHVPDRIDISITLFMFCYLPSIIFNLIMGRVLPCGLRPLFPWAQ